MSVHAKTVIDCDGAGPGLTCAYLRVAGDECAFIETFTSRARDRMLGALAAAGKRVEDVRWIVVTHAHLDHAAGASALLQACPRATLLAHPRAARHLIDPSKLVKSATAVYGAERFAEVYGTIDPIPAERVRALDDGATFPLGDATLQVHFTAGHANHHFVVHDPALDTVYTGDSFGLVYPALQRGGRFVIASTSPTNFDAVEARKSIDRILALGTTTACLTHFGEASGLAEIASQLRAWIDRAEAWVDEAARGDETVDAMTERLTRAWRAAVVETVASLGLRFDDAQYRVLDGDMAINAQGLAVVADARRSAARTPSVKA